MTGVQAPKKTLLNRSAHGAAARKKGWGRTRVTPEAKGAKPANAVVCSRRDFPTRRVLEKPRLGWDKAAGWVGRNQGGGEALVLQGSRRRQGGETSNRKKRRGKGSSDVKTSVTWDRTTTEGLTIDGNLGSREVRKSVKTKGEGGGSRRKNGGRQEWKIWTGDDRPTGWLFNNQQLMGKTGIWGD